MRNRRYTIEQLRVEASKARSISQLLKNLGLSLAGSNYEHIKRLIKENDINTEHFRGKAWREGLKGRIVEPKPLQELLVKGKPCKSPHSLKKRLIDEGILEYKCYICGIDEWQGKQLVLHLDHINGDREDNRKINLRLLCPNCHSQTDTYTGRNIKVERAINKCEGCGIQISPKANNCRKCSARTRKYEEKIKWPSDNFLFKSVEEKGFVKTGRILGVSDNAIRKRLRNKGLL